MIYIEVDRVKQLHELNPNNESGNIHVVIHSKDSKPFEYAVLYAESLNAPNQIEMSHVESGYVEFDTSIPMNTSCYLMVASSTEETIQLSVVITPKDDDVAKGRSSANIGMLAQTFESIKTVDVGYAVIVLVGVAILVMVGKRCMSQKGASTTYRPATMMNKLNNVQI
jgi:hypothetical protein